MKNPTTTMFLHQNVIVNNKPYTYNQATGAYQEANVQYQQQANVQYQRQANVQYQRQANVQYQQQANVQYQQQANVQYQQQANVQYQQQANVQYQQQVVYVQPKFQQVNVQRQPFYNNYQRQSARNYYLTKVFSNNAEAFNDEKGNRFTFPGATLCESIYLITGNNVEAPSSKLNISPLVQYQQRQVNVQRQPFYNNYQQQPARNYYTTKVVCNNAPQQKQAFHNHLPTKLLESICLTKEEAERIMQDLNKKFPKPDNKNFQKQPIQNNNNKYNNYLPTELSKSIFITIEESEKIRKELEEKFPKPDNENFQKQLIDNRSSELTKVSLEAPSSKLNISSLKQFLQLLNPLNCCLRR